LLATRRAGIVSVSSSLRCSEAPASSALGEEVQQTEREAMQMQE